MSTVRTTRLCKSECSCGRIVRVSNTVYQQGPIVCGLCRKPFVMATKDVNALRDVRGRVRSKDRFEIW